MTGRRRVIDFGFDPEASRNHFVVAMVSGDLVLIGERHEWAVDDDVPDVARPKVILDSYHWERIADRVSDEFNRRLRVAGIRAGRWKRGETLLAAHFGKELTLLAWAVEGADPTVIPAMLGNWSGLAPEERWWLYTTINATFVRPDDQPRGWRKAIKIAFAENPVEAAPSALLSASPPSDELAQRSGGPRRGRGGRRAAPEAQVTMELPGVQEDTGAYEADEPEENKRS